MDNKNKLCIEDIMQEIRQSIKEKNLSSDMLSFEDVPYRTAEDAGDASDASSNIANSLRYINIHYNIQPYKPLAGNPVKVFIKKVIRKLVKFYVEPIVFEQNEINGHSVQLINSIMNDVKTREKDNENMKDLEERIEILELNQKNLSVQIDMLEKENKLLKQKLGK